jgi:hypothetical protein
MPLATLLWAGNVLTTVLERGKVRLGATLMALLAFIIAAGWLTPVYGAAGAALALTLAVTVNVVVSGFYLWSNFRN